MALEINPDYLFNFTEKEKKAFYKQQRQENVDLDEYETKLWEMMCSDSKAIFANNDPYPFSRLDVKYTINRLAKDDPTLTHLPFGYGDPVRGDSDAVLIANASKTNTHCQSYELKDCGFTDAGAMLILNALRNKKVAINLAGNRLTDITFQYAVDLMTHQGGQWTSLAFGAISPSAETKQLLAGQDRISYLWKPKKSLLQILKPFTFHR